MATSLNERVLQRFGVEPHPVAYAGGVMGMEVSLPREEFSAALVLLIEAYGAPVAQKIWHPDQVFAPLLFGIDPNHVNLMLLGRSLKRQRAVMTFWPETGER